MSLIGPIIVDCLSLCAKECTEPQRPRCDGTGLKQPQSCPRIIIEPVSNRFCDLGTHYKKDILCTFQRATQKDDAFCRGMRRSSTRQPSVILSACPYSRLLEQGEMPGNPIRREKDNRNGESVPPL